MRALVLQEYGKLELQDVPKPEIGSDEVLLRVKACGICGSDVHGFDGASGRRVPPLIMGHEGSGVIEELGSEVTDWKVGDRVTFDSTVYSLKDWYTLSGHYNLSDGREVFGVAPGDYTRHGAFAEFLAVPQHVLHKIPDAVSFEEAAMVEPVAVALHAVNQAELKLGDSCAIVGVGTIGLFILKLLKIAGVAQVAAIDLSEANRETARSSGADLVFEPEDEHLVEKLKQATDGRGADAAFEAVGIEATVNLTLDLLRKGGTGIFVGNVSPTVNFPLQKLVTHELKIKGSCAIRGEYPIALQLIEKGKIDVTQNIAAVAPLADGAGWFKRLHQGEVSGKVILVP